MSLSLKGKTFRHGIHPEEYKEYTRDLPVERMPFVREYILPLSQHLGAPSIPIVKPGDRVIRGQKIARSSGFVSASLHSPVTGVITEIAQRIHPSGRMQDAIVVERDLCSPQEMPRSPELNIGKMDTKGMIAAVEAGGFVGLGGAAFPSHVKLSVPPGKKARFFMINASECEPYLNSDFRLLLEDYDSLFYGIGICMKILGAEKTYVGVEMNKPDAIELLNQKKPAGLNCEIVPLKTKYPQGAEKMLIDAVLKREVPSGKLPIDVETVVNNAGTVAGIGDYFRFGRPLIERIVTVTGPGIRRPANLMVPIGTKLEEVLEYCGGLTEDTVQVLYGGPMMGQPQRDMDVPVLKGTSGIVCLTEKEVFDRKEMNCIRCLRCVDACPIFLNPSLLGSLARVSRNMDMMGHNIMDCMECGSCSYVCPSHIPLVQRFRVAKALIREEMAREKAAGR